MAVRITCRLMGLGMGGLTRRFACKCFHINILFLMETALDSNAFSCAYRSILHVYVMNMQDLIFEDGINFSSQDITLSDLNVRQGKVKSSRVEYNVQN